ncbi:DUF6458 family protein [Mariniluteicoccus flavus]
MTMGIGLGILLLLIGAVLTFALDVNIPGVEDDTLGWILMVVGALALILSLVLNAMRNRTRHVSETRVEGAPTRRRTTEEL